MIITKEVAILALRKFPDLAVEMSLGKKSLLIYKYVVDNGRVKASSLSRDLNISIFDTRVHLLNLQRKGYLGRDSKSNVDKTWEYVYFPMFNGTLNK